MEQGNVLRLLYHRNLYFTRHCLNPFGTGQCLTTLKGELQKYTDQSQSLWNRAMSYDETLEDRSYSCSESQSLWNRAMSYDVKITLKPKIGNLRICVSYS